jgi:hypothetical protein
VASPIEAQVWFERGRALEAARSYDEAFASFAEGNRLRRADLDPAGFLAAVDRSVEANRAFCTPAFFQAHLGEGHPSQAPIFVIGLPRSGSTLIEQILVAHPGVRTVGECNRLSLAMEGRRPFMPSGPDHFRRLGALYLEALREAGWRGSRRVVDKTLINYRALPLLKLLFPKARIIHAVRDPMDACLALFRHNFADSNDAFFDLEDIATHYRRYREIMHHWSAMAPGAVVEVRHDALVDDPEGQIRRLIDAVGLGWDPACLAFHTARQRVRDGDADAVRRPLTAAGVGRWRAYKRQLEPLIATLGPYAAQSMLGGAETSVV